MNRDHHVLWTVVDGDMTMACVMVSCCAGAELDILRSGAEQIVLRELYPDRESLYERARELKSEIRPGLLAPPGAEPT